VVRLSSAPSRPYARCYYDGRVNISVYRPSGKREFWGRIADLRENGMGATVSRELTGAPFARRQFVAAFRHGSTSAELIAPQVEHFLRIIFWRILSDAQILLGWRCNVSNGMNRHPRDRR
jgi:hypothetical protein